MRVVFLAIFLIFAAASVKAQSSDYQEGELFYSSDGAAQTSHFRYDPFFDRIHYLTADGQEGVFGAKQLAGFEQGGESYYAMSFAGDQRLFFKVLYEGSAFAVLQKEISCSLVQYLCTEYPHLFRAEEDPATGKARLLYRSTNTFIADMAEEMELESATFIATPSGITLFQLQGVGTAAVEAIAHAQKEPQGLQMISLKKLFGNEQFAQARKIIKGKDLKLDSPSSIADAFRQLDAQL